MTERLAFIVFAGLTSTILGNPIIIVAAVLILAAVILVTAIFLFHNSGKKKSAKSGKQGGETGWKPQEQGQQTGAPAGWNQQGMGAQADNWGQQQQQPGANAWGAQAPAQQPGAWGAQPPAQQPGANAWGAQPPAQQQQPGAWGAQSSAQQPGANTWAAQPSAQPPQQGTWGAQSPAQQSGANAWGAQAPSPSSQQAQPGVWGNPTPNTPSTGAGIGGGQPMWDATVMPQQSAGKAQDPWGQPPPQSSPLQQGASVWGGMPNNAPAQPQTAYGGSGSGQSWGQSGQLAQPAQPGQPSPANDAWGQPAAQQAPSWGQPPLQQASSTPAAASSNAALPSWQQPVPGPGQSQGYGTPGTGAGGFGTPGMGSGGFAAPGLRPDAASLFGGNDNDKTVLRPGGLAPQGFLGTVRVEEGKEPGKVYEVRKDELSIGRSRDSDIFLEDLAVSRLHAKIVSLGNGNYALKDEGSANGTKVNGQLVNKYQTYNLQEGDKIQLGQTVLVFARR